MIVLRLLVVALAFLVAASCSVAGEPVLGSPTAQIPSEIDGPIEPPDTSPGGSETGETSAVAGFSRRRALRHVRRLSRGIGVRVRTTNGELRAGRYVRDKFRALGYRVKVQWFDVDGGKSRNIVAWWPGAIRHPVVIGGHMDTVLRSPGGNDNASGVGVILENARNFAGTRQAKFVRWVAFGSEEYGSDGSHHVGSQDYVRRLSARGVRRTPGMISVDMVGKLMGRPFIVGTAGIGPEVVAHTLFRIMQRAGIDVEYRTLCDCSDNGPFERAGIPGSFMWSGDEPNYHSRRDRFRNVSKLSIKRAGWSVRAFVKHLRRRTIRRFRRH